VTEWETRRLPGSSSPVRVTAAGLSRRALLFSLLHSDSGLAWAAVAVASDKGRRRRNNRN
jgi:hypothetical protein